MPCAISFDLFQNRLDLALVLRLAKPSQSRAAPLVCCSAVIRQEYLTPSLTLMDSKGHASAAGRPKFLEVAPSSSKSLQVPPPRTHLIRSWEALSCHLGAKMPIKTPSWTKNSDSNMFRKALLYVLRMFVRSFPQSAGPRIGAAPVDWRSLFNPAQHPCGARAC